MLVPQDVLGIDRLHNYLQMFSVPSFISSFAMGLLWPVASEGLLDHRKSKRVPGKHLLLLHWLHRSLWWCGSQQTVENSSRDGSTRPPHLSPEKPDVGQEATVRTGHGTTDWFKIGKGVLQAYILSPCLLNLHAEYLMWNARLDEAQAGIKIAREISITSDMQITSPLWQKAKRN